MPILYITALLLLIQTGIIAASAFTRLNLYQDAYGFTVLRLYTEWFILFLFGIFAVIGYGIIANMDFRKNFLVLWIYGLVSLTLVVSLNVDNLIVKKNIAHAQKTNTPLDLYYIRFLSYDALPTLTPYLASESGWNNSLEVLSSPAFVEDRYINGNGSLSETEDRLYNLSVYYIRDKQSDAWQEYHYGYTSRQKQHGINTLSTDKKEKLWQIKNKMEQPAQPVLVDPTFEAPGQP